MKAAMVFKKNKLSSFLIVLVVLLILRPSEGSKGCNDTSIPEKKESPATGLKTASTGIDPAKIEERRRLEYISRFAKLAESEQRKFGIPASITLAQGILESRAGQSKLAEKHNNHFGVKCFSKKCKKGHCVNFNDDSRKDFFRKYETAWESFRAHSILLRGPNYRHLKKSKDYKAWATGLKKAGYATNPKYDKLLIHIIEKYKLYSLDGDDDDK